ncbi:hypothetical protein J6590_033867 [Homalodisca vitripennis]|nr:hypothetical protein J6590_033867 [Homalodisca vitripennis]
MPLVKFRSCFDSVSKSFSGVLRDSSSKLHSHLKGRPTWLSHSRKSPRIVGKFKVTWSGGGRGRGGQYPRIMAGR